MSVLLKDKEYDRVLEEYDRISRLPLMRYRTVKDRLRVLYLADKWEQLKAESD